jgi:lipid-A-disaccharide synthase
LECIEVSDLVLLGTGSSVIESALLGKPMVNFIRVNPVSYFVVKRMIKVKFISLVNILADKMIYKEFVQEECTVKNIFDESIRILTDKDYRLKLDKTISPVLAHLGNGETTCIAAQAIQDYISSTEGL